MVDDTARDRAIYHALKAADEVAAALQTHLIEEHGADPDRAAPQSPATNSLKLLRQARERLGQGLRAVQADQIAESDGSPCATATPATHELTSCSRQKRTVVPSAAMYKYTARPVRKPTAVSPAT